ncbi:MAG: hypothetical protein CM1200mP26_18740 [Acidimicrobiales bacterium]|nr:MAG: hypothetical protein CM1200mP26_18740 [Acidimicrobiales bacterium]
MLLGFGKPDEGVNAEGTSNFIGQEAANRPSVDPLHNLADDPSVGDGVVAVGCPRLPQGFLILKGPKDRFQVADFIKTQDGVESSQPRAR